MQCVLKHYQALVNAATNVLIIHSMSLSVFYARYVDVYIYHSMSISIPNPNVNF